MKLKDRGECAAESCECAEYNKVYRPGMTNGLSLPEVKWESAGPLFSLPPKLCLPGLWGSFWQDFKEGEAGCPWVCCHIGASWDGCLRLPHGWADPDVGLQLHEVTISVRVVIRELPIAHGIDFKWSRGELKAEQQLWGSSIWALLIHIAGGKLGSSRSVAVLV